jgi:hypothetical protein
MLSEAERRAVGTVSIDNPRDLAIHFGKVQVPPGVSGNLEVREVHFTDESPWEHPGERPVPGPYTELLRDGEPWLSSFPDEVARLMPLFRALNRAPRESRVLLLGMGLGVHLRAALVLLHRGPIDIIEANPHVLALMQPHWEEMADFARCEVRFHFTAPLAWERAAVDRWHIGYASAPDERLASIYAPRCLWFESGGNPTASAPPQ